MVFFDVAYFLIVVSLEISFWILLSVLKLADAIALLELFILTVPGTLLFKLIVALDKSVPSSPLDERIKSGVCFFIVQVNVLSEVVSSLQT